MSGRPVNPGGSRIVLLGAPAYHDPRLPDAPVIANNIADLAAVFTDPQIGGFDVAHCVTAPPGAGIAEVGDLLVRAASEAEDLLLFYYSGHGLLGTRSHELYLSLAATRLGQLPFTALPFAAVREACLESGAKSRVVILDSCFSGRAIGETLGADDEILGQVEVKGTYTLTSAPANRTALILPGEQHTAFTERLLRLLRDGSPQAGEMLSLGDIYRHLHTRLRAEGLPVPQQRGTETADLLGLVRNCFAPGMTHKDSAAPGTPQPVTVQVSQDVAGRASPVGAAHQPSRELGHGPSIAMWGAPYSGKTTFLAALSIAVNRLGRDWNVTPANDASEAILINATAELAGRGTFPEATSGVEEYQWVLQRPLAVTARRRFRTERQASPVRIDLDLVDVSGTTTSSRQDELIRHLARSRGIVYTFDPIREYSHGDAYERIFGVCNQLGRTMLDDPEFDGRLPQHLAVCITKFDEIRVLETARRLTLVTTDPRDPYGFPRVHDDGARDLFRRLCEVSAGRNGDMVITVLEQYFRPERIRYFVTSAIGFHTNAHSGKFDPDDPLNVLQGDRSPQITRIRGAIHPINVVEPLLWLGEQLAGATSQGTGSRAPS